MQKSNDGADAREQKKDEDAPQPTSDPKLTDPEKTPGSGMFPEAGGEAPSG